MILPCDDCLIKAICINIEDIFNLLKCSILNNFVISKLKLETGLDIDELYENQYERFGHENPYQNILGRVDETWYQYDSAICSIIFNISNFMRQEKLFFSLFGTQADPDVAKDFLVAVLQGR